ncbi:protein kinase PKP2 [Sugiyamaella lignohabitans]|uniref:Protein-serine/threonine kinase n=1 Tax=Sugiyamaella lignohabitans TaxID=796027 RepID=A0A167F269_9ASCO|nr:protein kinase PKP2 [Sugiyamaella lignohabitans]ANB14729.1 protein kinase PKP2 [Sugiyamaella lignohabitans]
MHRQNVRRGLRLNIRPRSSTTSWTTVTTPLLSRNQSHVARINLLNSSAVDSEGNSASRSYTYPKNSTVINERHFYQNTVLMDWVNKAPRPVSLRQLAFFGRKLTPEKIISSANFVQVELPVRLAHRVRDMQQLPFAVVSNTHISPVYEQYYKAFDKFRKFPLITTLEQNDEFCNLLTELLDEHLSIIPKLVMGAIECSMADCIDSDRLDSFMSTMLCSRISRRVIAEQHLSLSKTFRANQGQTELPHDPNFIGAVFLQCSARKSVSQCAKHATALIQELYPDLEMPKIEVEVQQQSKDDITFPYIKSHLDYIIGELLRNSIEATVLFWQKKHAKDPAMHPHPPPITVSISNTPQNVFIRISDLGGGVPQDVLPHIWSFAKGPRSLYRLQNFKQVPTLAGLSDEVGTGIERSRIASAFEASDTFLRTGRSDIDPEEDPSGIKNSLASLTSRSSHLKLGMGLPLSRVYAEYWDGALDLHSLEGYGCDVFLKISRLGNQMERLSLDRV